MPRADEYISIYRVRTKEEEQRIKQALADQGIPYISQPVGEQYRADPDAVKGEILVKRAERRAARVVIENALREQQGPPPFPSPPELSPKDLDQPERRPLFVWLSRLGGLLVLLVMLGHYLSEEGLDFTRLLQKATEGYEDFDGDGKKDGWTRPMAGGKRVYRYWDEDQDGNPERVDGLLNGVLVYTGLDEDENDVYEKESSFRQDGSLEWVGYDADQDGLREAVESFYPDGKRMTRAEDRDKDGIYEIRWWYDREGRRREENHDEDKDEIMEKALYFDEQGRMTMILYDTTGDGMPNKREYYDPAGRLLKTGYDDNYDYEMDRWEYPGQ